MKRTLAALDIGTNTTLFLLAEVTADGAVLPIQHDLATNDLGRGLDADFNLTPEAIALNVDQLRRFGQIAQEYGAEEIRIAATEALRKARNAHLLLHRVKTELGLTIRIISGEEEARLTYLGILSGLPEQDEPLIAVDVGGGSTEVILGEGRTILFSRSLPVGAVSLDKQFLRSDPPELGELVEVEKAINVALDVLPQTVWSSKADLIICGGTASSLAAADLGLVDYEPEKLAGHEISKRRMQQFLEQFTSCTLEQRRKIPGIGYRRAEIILPGTMIIWALLRRLKRKYYFTSERGLRYGLLVEGI
ncbi:MAG: Ppx/GppA phosphatase family protein [bacterium]|nr:Ppx/GppA phosphatase family protein [bacterium]